MLLTEFTESDFYAFDAKHFVGGALPLLGTLIVGGVEAAVVYDRRGVSVTLDVSVRDGAVVTVGDRYFLPARFNTGRAVALLGVEVTTARLVQLGFRRTGV